MKKSLEHIKETVANLTIVQSLAWLVREYENQVVFSTSFGVEDQIIAHLILTEKLPISIFTLDTGRLFTETYTLWSRTNEKYQAHIDAYYPNSTELQNFVTQHGPNAFYESVELRKQCCAVRKIEPLKRAIANKKIWITGLRAEHSSDREQLPQVEWDESNQIIKYHPLLHWKTAEVFQYVRDHNILYNPLHDKGFVSIGCAPCTRAIREGEDFRAGRWWWEDSTKKECGLHH